MNSLPFLLAFVPYLLLCFFGAHAIADYGLQSSYMAEKKVRAADNPDWAITLSAHAFMHAVLAGVVAFAFLLFIGKEPPVAAVIAAIIGWLEFAAHFLIDNAKGQKRMSYRTDQMLHYSCKIVWTGALIGVAV